MSGSVLHPWTVTLQHDVHVPIDGLTALLYAVTAVAVAVLALRRPANGIAALIVLAPFGPIRYLDGTSLTLLKAGLIGLLLSLAIRRPDAAAFATFPFRAVAITFVLAELAIALSGLHAEYRASVLREAFKTLEYFALFFAGVSAYASDPDDRPFWRALQIVTTLVCISALAQYLTGANAGIFIDRNIPVPRIAGALEGPNQLAGWLEVAVPVLLARNLLHRDGALVAVVVLAAVTELLTFSRAGIVATVFASALVLLLMRTPRAVGMRFAITAIAVAAVLSVGALKAGLPPRYFSLDQVPQSDHLGNRALLWRAAIDLWTTSPIVGVGAGNYEFDLSRVGLPDVRTHANSIYLQSLAEGGIVMLGTTILSFLAAIYTLASSGVRRPVVVGMLAATAALAMHQVFDDLFFFPKVGSMYWLTLGVAVAEIAASELFARRRGGVRRTLISV